jgi:hypothetical protein
LLKETPFGESYDAKKGRDREEARMPKYRVMCYRQGVWDGQDARIVEAETESDAAKQIVGEGLVEGADRQSSVYVKVWPHLPPAKWFSKSTTPL